MNSSLDAPARRDFQSSLPAFSGIGPAGATDEMSHSSRNNLPSENFILLCLAIISAVTFIGAAGAFWMCGTTLGRPDPRDWFNVFYVLFARNEVAGLALVAVFATLSGLWFWRGCPSPRWPALACPQLSISLVAVVVFTIAGIGTSRVFHEYALTADENMADFQARIFLRGKVQQEVPHFWQPMVRLIMPTHAVYNAASHSWMSSYLPVYAALRAAFMSVGLEWFTNPFLAALSIFAIAAVTRKIWPEDPWKPLLAAALLAASPQFLVMSMTSYAMPAHLALNLIWLWLYCDPTKRRFWFAPIVGIAALGLHQPFFHALFVTPFLVRLVLTRRWRATVWYAAVYFLGIACWYAWWKHFYPPFSGNSPRVFGLHHGTLLIQCIYLALMLGWLAFPVPLLTLLGLSRIRKQPPLIHDAAASCLLTFGFYVFVLLDQAHGWGDRYFHGALGCLILLSIVGWDALVDRIGKHAAVTFVVVGLGVATLVQLPLRSTQAEHFVRPFARASAAFHETDADLVVFEPRMAWYSADLRRNSPFLREDRPVVVSFFPMTKGETILLQKTFPQTHLVNEAELSQFGLATRRALP